MQGFQKAYWKRNWKVEKGRKAWIWPQNQYRQEVLHCQHLSTKHWLCVTSSPRIPHAELAGAEGSLENQQDVPKYSGLRNTCVKSSFCGAEGDEVPQSLSERGTDRGGSAEMCRVPVASGRAAAGTGREGRATASAWCMELLCSSPPCFWSVQGVESHRALEIAPEPFHVSGASCAAGPLFSPPRFLGHGRPSLPCRHKWLQWGSCQTLCGLIYDAPLAHFELWLLPLFSRI